MELGSQESGNKLASVGRVVEQRAAGQNSAHTSCPSGVNAAGSCMRIETQTLRGLTDGLPAAR